MFQSLATLAARCESLPAFQETRVPFFPRYGRLDAFSGRSPQKALMPVSSRPIVSWWMVSVPS